MREKNGFTRQIFKRFFVPTLFSGIGLGVANIADALVVGNRMGEKGLAAISIVLPVFMFYNVFGVGLAVGGSTHVSKLLTEGNEEQAVSHFNQILWFSLLLSVGIAVLGNLFLPQILWGLGAKDKSSEMYHMALAYSRILLAFAPVFFLNLNFYYFLRSDDAQEIAAWGYVVSCGLDVLLNYILVIHLDVGVTGAIWATVIAQSTAVLMYLPHFIRKKSILRVKMVRLYRKELFASFELGFSSSVQYIFQFFMILIVNQLLIWKSGETGVAVFDIVLNVSYIALFFFTASADSLLPIISVFTGERDVDSEKESVWLAIVYSVFGNCIWNIVLAVFASQVCRIFGLTEEESIIMGEKAIRFYLLSTLFAGFNLIEISISQAKENVKGAFFLVALRSFFLLIPCVFVCSMFGTEVTFLGYVLAEGSSFLVWKKVIKKKVYQNKQYVLDIYARQIETHKANIGEILSEIEAFCEKNNATMKQQYYVTMVVEEITTAIMEHAFQKENGFIRFTLFVNEEGDFELHIRDSARKFNLFDLKTEALKIEGQEEEVAQRIGIYMVKKKAKHFFYRNYQGFNSLIVKI